MTLNMPNQDPAIRTIAMPADTNPAGDIFGGWLLSQMDLAGGILAGRVAKGRVATVAISSMSFLNPVPVGAVVGCYAQTLSVGTSSIRILIEAWIDNDAEGEQSKVTEGEFVFVAIDDNGNTREVPTA